MNTRVFNLATQEEMYFSCSPRDAVISAYAQSRGDWNTWDYEYRYGHLVEASGRAFYLGDFGSFYSGS